MSTCDACLKNSLLPEQFGNLTLCKKCSLKLLSPTWKNKVYTTNEEVVKQQQSTMKLAAKAGFPQSALNELNAYFEGLKIEGLVKAFDGGACQSLVVFEDFCIIDTDENFDAEEIEEAYWLIMQGKRGKSVSSQKDEEAFARQEAAAVAKNLLSNFAGGGSIGKSLARAGAEFAANAVSRSSQEDSECTVSIPDFNIRFGQQKMRLR